MSDCAPSGTKVSVVIPAYNAAATIVEAIESALDQTHANVELIVVDDGSTDSTAEQVRSVVDSRLTLVRIPNSGPSAARNRGIQLASGDFVAFLDSDDIWLPEKLAAQLTTLTRRPSAGAVYGFLDQIDSAGGHRAPMTRQGPQGRILETLLVWNLLGNGSNLLVRRSALDAVGGFDESLAAAEDWELGTRLAQYCEFACVPEVLSLYRRRPNSLTTNVSRLEQSYLRAHRKVYARVPETLRELRILSLAVFYQYLATQGRTQSPRRPVASLGYALKSLYYGELSRPRLSEPTCYPFNALRLDPRGVWPVSAAVQRLFRRGRSRR